MAKLLYISANPKGPKKSKGMQIGEAFLRSFIDEQPNIEITKIDLFQFDMVRMDADLISARGKLAAYGMTFEELTNKERAKISKMHGLVDEFIQYDYFVFVSPLWNLGSPAVLKTFLDNLFVSGKTFVHTANGPKGLLAGKTAIHIQTRGGMYTGLPVADLESGDRYLKIALRFLGIQVLDTIIAEGLDAFSKKAPEIVEDAKVRAADAAKEMASKSVFI
ncbi:FMN-dependent NADH-azoreductase [Neobacillus sp. SCS-31]|uniref:FMN-dependent NADH-azoreductase n=1 Tax=Neobacillus oceani TaxID=3115292 RepID=UPI003905A027